MKTVYALQPLQNSIFLAGPTPRDEKTPSWRPEAIKILESIGYRGTVFVPESHDWKAHDSYDAQVDWEWEALNQATAVAFWVPRELDAMPAFTTNVEFGYLASSGKAVLGAPEGAPKLSYLKRLAARHGIECWTSLEALLRAACKKADLVHAAGTR